MSESINYIPNRIKNAAVGGHVCGAVDIIDDVLGLEQSSINEDVAPMPYNDGNPNGMGRIILKKTDNFKNVVEAQSGNTIFIIKYDFTLTGNVTVPANCVLEFDGGSVSGAQTLTGANTGIKAGIAKIFNTDVTLAGIWNVAEVYSEWFGAISDGITNASTELQKALNLASISKGKTVRMLIGMYKVSNITVPINTSIKGVRPSGNNLTGNGTLLVSDDTNNSVLKPQEGATVIDLGFWYPTQTSETPIAYPASIYVGDGCDYVNIRNIVFLASYEGIKADNNHINLVVDNCVGAIYKYGIHIVHADDIDRISNCHFNYNILKYNVEYNASYNPEYIADYSFANGTAYYVEHGDWITFTNCFALLFNVGFQLGAYPAQYTVNAPVLNGGGADCCKVGIRCYTTYTAKISNMHLNGGNDSSFTDEKAFDFYKCTNIEITNCTIESIDGQMLQVITSDNITITNCTFNCSREENVNFIFYLTNAQEITIANCTIRGIPDMSSPIGRGLFHVGTSTLRLLGNYFLIDSTSPFTIFDGNGISQTCWIESRDNIYRGLTWTLNKDLLLNLGPTSHLSLVPTTLLYEGFEYFDTTANKPLYWKGNAWVDAIGTPV